MIPIQNIIPEKVVKMAKAMQEAEKDNKHLIIIQARQTGKTMARKLANGEQVLNSNLLDPN